VSFAADFAFATGFNQQKMETPLLRTVRPCTRMGPRLGAHFPSSIVETHRIAKKGGLIVRLQAARSRPRFASCPSAKLLCGLLTHTPHPRCRLLCHVWWCWTLQLRIGQFVALYLGMLTDIILAVLFALSVVLIYNLLMINVQKRTFEVCER
jgi:hypothetical protein